MTEADTQRAGETAPPAPTERARAVGRGALLITGGKGWFLVTATAVNLGLASVLGAVDYGNYGVTIRWVSLLNMMVVQGMLQGVSRAVSAQPGAAQAFRRQALRPVALVAALAGLFLLGAARPLAALLEDNRLAPLFATSALITVAYAFYAAFVGVLNGAQRFRAQALTDMGFSTAKMVFILGAAALGLGAAGSVAGFGLAAVVLAVVTWFTSGSDAREAPGTPLTVRSLLAFGGLVMAYQACLNLQMFVDLGVVKRATGEGMLPAELAGHYAGATNVAQIPYLACTAITFVLFPLLGAAGTRTDQETRELARRATRYALLVAGIPAVALIAAAPGLLRAVFPMEYMGAAPALRLLAVAYVLAALSSVTCTMLNALGRPQLSVLSVMVGVLVTLGLAPLLVEPWGLTGPAAATACGMTSTWLVSLRCLAWTGRGAFAWSSLVRMGGVMAALAAVGAQVPWPVEGAAARLVGLGGGALAAVAALVLLWVVGEIGQQDLALLRGIISRKKGA
ncbi:MAG: polysaccharide biosynthesis C-terminal domain-containing protein [Deltaproteobacteria bacterium]|nr:polysaccharide biosynthesis C-terminal domain-containing protein [Deltaproteobacteria bacterium]